MNPHAAMIGLAITPPSGVTVVLPLAAFTRDATLADPTARLEVKNVNGLRGVERAALVASEVLLTAAEWGYYLRHSLTVSPKRLIDAPIRGVGG